MVVDYDISADVGSSANLRRRSDDRRGMNPGFVGRSFVEQVDHTREGQVGILGAQHAGRHSGEVFRDDDGGGGGGLGDDGVLWIRDEGDLAGRGFFDTGDARDFNVAVRIVKRGVEGGGDVGKFHGWSWPSQILREYRNSRSLASSSSLVMTKQFMTAWDAALKPRTTRTRRSRGLEPRVPHYPNS